MKSYVSTRLGPLARISEFRDLYRRHTKDVGQSVRGLLEEARFFDEEIARMRGGPVAGLRILEIGPGQQLVEMTHFGASNEVIGIDTDLIAKDAGLASSLRMLRSNGALRTAKTLSRKALGIDRRARAEVLTQLGLKTAPEFTVLQMDAANMTFPDGSFDVVYSRAVFEHLQDPSAVIAEVRRVLKPGGVMFVRLHLYTSDSGIHDARIFAGQRDGLPYWSHLRPAYEHLARPNSYLNKVRLDEWTRLFTRAMEGSKVTALRDAPEPERLALEELRAGGELAEYSDVELLSPTVDVIWRKPE